MTLNLVDVVVGACSVRPDGGNGLGRRGAGVSVPKSSRGTLDRKRFTSPRFSPLRRSPIETSTLNEAASANRARARSMSGSEQRWRAELSEREERGGGWGQKASGCRN